MSYPIQEAYALVIEDDAGNEGLPPVMEITPSLRGLPLLCGNALTCRIPPDGVPAPRPLRVNELWCAATLQPDGSESLGGLTITHGQTKVLSPTAGGDADRLFSLITREECGLVFAAGQRLFRLTRREELT